MPRFPRTKEDIMVFGGRVLSGIQSNPTIYANPPFDTSNLSTSIFTAMTAMTERQTKEGEYRDAVAAETDAIDAVAEAIRPLLDLAVQTYPDDAGKLEMIGWNVAADPRHLPPGQVRNLEVDAQGPGSALLDWKAPARTQSVGAVRYYRVEREIRNIENDKITEEFGEWQATSTRTEILLHSQPRRVEIRYRVIAVNPNGDGPHSDTEAVVL